ncbi:MAG: anthranilate synthase component I family protein [Alphaproteobacteria bacterium]
MKAIKIHWQDPAIFAKKIAENYQGNWVFLYSALANIKKNSKSYIALFEEDRFCGEDFENLVKKITKNEKDWWFGGINYEAGEQFENIFNQQKSIVNFPNFFFVKFRVVLVFDHQKKTIKIKTKSKKLIDEILSYKLNKSNFKSPKIENFNSNFTDQEYLLNIKKIQEMIGNGDFFQANLTRKFYGKFTQKLSNLQSFQLFLKLIEISPTNYLAYANFDEKFILSSSPELFLKSKNNSVLSSPIKGTVARGLSKKEDLENKKYLQNSTKEKAENLMIVDLMRNDFARFCEPSSVGVKKLFEITKYQMIYHLSSDIVGKIDSSKNIFDALRASFPAGSMTGAPKIKSMEILNQIEKMPRGLYSGAFGFIKNCKEMNFSVVIRTLLIENDFFEFQVGGGITYESSPEKELAETYSKGRAIFKILNLKN